MLSPFGQPLSLYISLNNSKIWESKQNSRSIRAQIHRITIVQINKNAKGHMHRYTKEQKRRNTKVQIHTNTKVQMHKTQNTTDLLPSPCNVLDRRPSSADNHPKTCVCRCNCHHFQHFHHFQDCLHCHHCHQLNIIGVRIAKRGEGSFDWSFFWFSISDDTKYCDCFPEASPSHWRIVIIIISHIAGGRLTEPVPTIRAAQIQSNSACWSDHMWQSCQ